MTNLKIPIGLKRAESISSCWDASRANNSEGGDVSVVFKLVVAKFTK